MRKKIKELKDKLENIAEEKEFKDLTVKEKDKVLTARNILRQINS